MKILVDAREAVRNKSGIGVVARKITAKLQSHVCDIDFIIIKPNESRIFNSSLGRLFEFIWWKVAYIRFESFWHKCDYTFSLDPINTLFGKNCISIIYDLIFFVYPQLTNQWGRLWRTLLPFSINKNVLIFSISTNTTNDIPKYIPKFNHEIPVKELALGYDKNIFRSTPIDYNFLLKYSLPASLQYIMFVGNAEPRRNLQSVIKAVAFCNESLGKEFHLIVCGKNDAYREEILRAAGRENIVQYVHVVGYVDDRELASFYRHARVYIYPSFYEGFGLTIIEAMACGCPVITSNTSSLKDVAGDAAILVDPADQASISKALEMVLIDKKLQQELIQAGYKNIEKYDWDIMVETIVSSLKGLSSHAHNS